MSIFVFYYKCRRHIYLFDLQIYLGITTIVLMDDQLYNQILHFISTNKYPGEIYKLPPENRVNAKYSITL